MSEIRGMSEEELMLKEGRLEEGRNVKLVEIATVDTLAASGVNPDEGYQNLDV